MFNIRKRFNRWRARRYLCRQLLFRHDTPDIVLRYFANTMGDQRDKLYAALLD